MLDTKSLERVAHLTRQLDIIPVDVLSEPITVIGAGAIGSFVVLALAKMGFENITVWDDDKVSIENMSCQFYRHSDVGLLKVQALHDIVRQFANIDIKIFGARYTGFEARPGIVISAVDSMLARKLIWDTHVQKGYQTKLVIDPRMTAEMALCFAMNPHDKKDQEAYQASLYNDDSAVAERCTAKSTMYCVLGISSIVANIVKQFLTKTPYIRTVQWDLKRGDCKQWLENRT